MHETKQEFLDYAHVEGNLNTDYEVTHKHCYFPFIDRDTKEPYRSTALIFTMSNLHKSNHYHTVIVAFKENNYYIWCGDSFISGFKSIPTNADAMKIVRKIAQSKDEELDMISLYATTIDKGCRFARDNFCSHVATALYMIDQNPSLLDELETMYNGVNTARKNRTPIEMLEKLHFVKSVMLQGDKGSGKTTLALQHAKKSGATSFFMGGNNNTEAADFIGEYIPMTVNIATKGQKSLFDDEVAHVSMVWKDGKLAQAFRHAASGKKAIFILDEALRIPQEELSPLISSLSPTPDGTLQLGTRRAVGVVDGLAEEEIIECPVENLWVIMTTNMGADYAVSEMDEAFADRVRLILMNSEESQIEKVLKEQSKAKGYPQKTVTPLMKFYKLYEKRRADGAFSKVCNLRHLVEAIHCSVDVDDIKETLWETRLAWVNNNIDGQPRVDQLNELTKILDKVYS